MIRVYWITLPYDHNDDIALWAKENNIPFVWDRHKHKWMLKDYNNKQEEFIKSYLKERGFGYKITKRSIKAEAKREIWTIIYNNELKPFIFGMTTTDLKKEIERVNKKYNTSLTLDDFLQR